MGKAMFRRGRMAAVVAAAVMVGTAACSGAADDSGSGSDSGSEGGLDALTVSVAFGPGFPAGAPLWIGEPLGFFEEEGLDVEIVTLPGKPAETVGLVVAGQADLVIAGTDAFVVPLSQGQDQGLVSVFTPYLGPTFGIATAADSDIRSARDLEGMTVGMPAQGAPYQTFMESNITADGGEASGIDIVTVQGAAAMEALRNGDIDAYVDNWPTAAQAADAVDLDVRKLPLPPDVEQQIGPGFLMRADATDEQKDVYARYLRAYTKGIIFSQENPEAATRLNWELYPTSKPADQSDEEAMAASVTLIEENMALTGPGDDDVWGNVTDDRWEAYVAGIGGSEAIPDVTVLYDYSLLDVINDFDSDEVREQAANHE